MLFTRLPQPTVDNRVPYKLTYSYPHPYPYLWLVKDFASAPTTTSTAADVAEAPDWS